MIRDLQIFTKFCQYWIDYINITIDSINGHKKSQHVLAFWVFSND